MKERRKDLLWEMALVLLTVTACLYSTGVGNIFGAKVDWSSQHSVCYRNISGSSLIVQGSYFLSLH